MVRQTDPALTECVHMHLLATIEKPLTGNFMNIACAYSLSYPAALSLGIMRLGTRLCLCTHGVLGYIAMRL